MEEKIIDAEATEVSTDIVQLDSPPPAPVAVPDEQRAIEVIDKAVKVSQRISEIVSKAGMYAAFADKHGNKHVHLTADAWQLIARFDGYIPNIEEVALIEHVAADGNTYQAAIARASLRRIATNEPVIFCEAICSREEDRWRYAPTYQLISMAQTRAIGKLGRSAYGYVVRLAGYESTPAEEMDASMYEKQGMFPVNTAQKQSNGNGYKGRKPNAPATTAQINLLRGLFKDTEIEPQPFIDEFCSNANVPAVHWKAIAAGDKGEIQMFPRWLASSMIDHLMKERDAKRKAKKAPDAPQKTSSEDGSANDTPLVTDSLGGLRMRVLATLRGIGIGTDADVQGFIEEVLGVRTDLQSLTEDELNFLANKAKQKAMGLADDQVPLDTPF